MKIMISYQLQDPPSGMNLNCFMPVHFGYWQFLHLLLLLFQFPYVLLVVHCIYWCFWSLRFLHFHRSWTLFVIFFLSPVGTVTLLRLELSCGTTHLFWLQQHKLLSYSTCNASVTDILRLQRLMTVLSYGTKSNTIQQIVTSIYESTTLYKISQHDNNIDMKIKHGGNDGKLIMLPNTPLHIIDHRSVLYLILQILLYNQQYVQDLLENNNDGNNDSVSSITVTSVITMKIIFYELYIIFYLVVT